MPFRIACLAILLVAVQAMLGAKPAGNPGTAAASQSGSEAPPMVIGFTGGFVRHDDMVHGPVQLAERLRHDLSAGTYVGIFENWHGERARAEILRRLSVNWLHAGSASLEEKQNARIILYGHSWGATQAILLARELEKDGVPVLLTVQVDSVAKPGQNDSSFLRMSAPPSISTKLPACFAGNRKSARPTRRARKSLGTTSSTTRRIQSAATLRILGMTVFS